MRSTLLRLRDHMLDARARFLNRYCFPLLTRGTGRRILREANEWRYENIGAVQPGLPDVLILGDSIAREYFPALVEKLRGRATLSLFATSKSVGDPTLRRELERFFHRAGRAYQAVYFTNGLHGWDYSEEEYHRYLPEFIESIKTGAPGARLCWVALTPMARDFPRGPNHARITARNVLARAEANRRGLPVLELPAPPGEYRDGIHFTPAGSAQQAETLAGEILRSCAAKS